MHLSKSPRALAALSFIWPATMSIGVLVILGNQLGSVSALFSLDPPVNTTVRFTCVALFIAFACGGLLLSPVLIGGSLPICCH
jgi:hypothetical protein